MKRPVVVPGFTVNITHQPRGKVEARETMPIDEAVSRYGRELVIDLLDDQLYRLRRRVT